MRGYETVRASKPQSRGRPWSVPAWIVDLIIRDYEAGCGFKRIARRLNDDATPTGHGAPRWSACTIRSILRSGGIELRPSPQPMPPIKALVREVSASGLATSSTPMSGASRVDTPFSLGPDLVIDRSRSLPQPPGGHDEHSGPLPESGGDSDWLAIRRSPGERPYA